MAIREVLTTALQRAGGLDDDDEPANRFHVYDREGQACRRRGCPGIIRRIVQSERSTLYCPVCQR